MDIIIFLKNSYTTSLFFRTTLPPSSLLELIMNQLRTQVRALNKDVVNFASLVEEGTIVPHMRVISSYTDESYQEAYRLWFPNAWLDFVNKMALPYRYFDMDTFYELDDDLDVDPNLYVSTKKRQIILGGFGSVWIDIDLIGSVHGKDITKWTRVCFVRTGESWNVTFDPTFDESRVFDSPEAAKFVNFMKTMGKDVDLTYHPA
jgi:hypothetical protein